MWDGWDGWLDDWMAVTTTGKDAREDRDIDGCEQGFCLTHVIAINDIFPSQYFIVCNFLRNMSKWHRRRSVRCSASHLWPPNLQHLNHSHCTETHLVCWVFHRIFLHTLNCTCIPLGILLDLSRPVNLSTSVLVKLTALTSPCHSHADHRKP